jgi:heptosyltransferase-1
MRVLIVKTSSMGDLIHTLPALTDAQKAIPNIQFDWVAEESFAEIPAWHPAVDRVIPIALRRWKKNLIPSIKQGEIASFIKNLKKNQYDYIIDAQGLIKSALVTRLAKGVRCGMGKYSLKEASAHFFYQHEFSVTRQAHAIERVRILFAKVLGYEYQQSVLDYGLRATDFKVPHYNKPYLVFLHATSRDSKLWDEEQWLKLRDKAHKDGFAVLLPWGSEQERQRAQRIRGDQQQCFVLPKMQLTDLAGLLANATAVVGVDTGLSHLAAALSVPGITLYLDTYPGLTGSCGTKQTCLTQMKMDDSSITMTGLHSLFYQHINAETVWKCINEKLGDM